MWAFSLKKKISSIIGNPRYPKHYPNTVVPEYGIVVHAKYELMGQAANLNPFQTKYIAWVDFGEFRFLSSSTTPFSLYLPKGFDEHAVAYAEVHKMKKLTPEHIFKMNANWLGGGFFVGRTDIMLSWTKEYMRYVEKYLAWGLSNTDQQVLYSMFCDNEKPHTKITAIYNSMGYHPWFFLGQMSMDAGYNKCNKTAS